MPAQSRVSARIKAGSWEEEGEAGEQLGTALVRAGDGGGQSWAGAKSGKAGSHGRGGATRLGRS